jgi:cytochrome c oxidase cbb3-type subunit 3
MSEYKHDQVREHAHDGIEEYDNRLPDWWLWILYGTIVFGIGYWLVFETMDMVPNPDERYALEMEAAAIAELERMAEAGTSNESLRLMSTVSERVSEGQQLFLKHCVACHAENAQGNIGPNLTDQYWIHGGEPMDLHATVTNGVLEKGMTAWGRQLGPRRVESVVAYVLTLRNTNVPGKEPQGELYEGE